VGPAPVTSLELVDIHRWLDCETAPVVFSYVLAQLTCSQRGTAVAALFYTLLESARMCGKDPRDHLLAATMRALGPLGAITLP